uniref:Uncharacterized protein n=1 Tax=Ananas comosus var. bracteatus TaxID=296719 RepID=A0A6V7NXC0_ANACO|nr:unnamed protein product [Ananas comosus var. bracteatus]
MHAGVAELMSDVSQIRSGNKRVQLEGQHRGFDVIKASWIRSVDVSWIRDVAFVDSDVGRGQPVGVPPASGDPPPSSPTSPGHHRRWEEPLDPCPSLCGCGSLRRRRRRSQQPPSFPSLPDLNGREHDDRGKLLIIVLTLDSVGETPFRCFGGVDPVEPFRLLFRVCAHSFGDPRLFRCLRR